MAIPASLRQDLGDIALLEDARSLRMRSRDFFWFSPILKEALEDKRAEIVAVPRDKADVMLSNPHTFILDNAGWKRVDAPQAEFKRMADPYGLMNPGKLQHWQAQDARAIAQ